MQHNQQRDLLDKAFQALLSHRQATYLLVNQQHQLLYICGDSLNLLSDSTSSNVPQDLFSRLPASLQLPLSEALAQTAGTTRQAGCPVGAQPYTVTITVSTQFASDIGEFLTVLIEREDHRRGHLEDLVNTRTAELVEANKHLQAEVLERQQAEQILAQQAQALARSNADLEEFAYVVSHDLQEPLRAMTAFSQLLEQRYKPQLEAAAQRYVQHIVDGGTRMKAMIDGILELSRISSAAQISNCPTSLERALKTALENLKLIRLETHATITHDTLPILYADENHIVQLLQNLIGNAIKFRGPKPPCIHIAVEQCSHKKWLFTVRDNGVGIPQDQQKRIFKLFQRLHNQQKHKGYGIGLAICKKIVEHYQGEIWLESASGEGATFYFTLVVDSAQDKA
ncbi:MAG: ATP-binding protein [Cyanobacteria bacterium P01_H01_bin.26]